MNKLVRIWGHYVQQLASLHPGKPESHSALVDVVTSAGKGISDFSKSGVDRAGQAKKKKKLSENGGKHKVTKLFV